MIGYLIDKILFYFTRRTYIYNICWEDPAVDHDVLQIEKDDVIFRICSAGDIVLDYAIEGPSKIVVCDLNKHQLWLFELKIRMLRDPNLTYDEWWAIWGSSDSKTAQAVWKRMRHTMSNAGRKWWDERIEQTFHDVYAYSGSTGFVAKFFIPIILWIIGLDIHSWAETNFCHKYIKKNYAAIQRAAWWLRYLFPTILAPFLGVPSSQMGPEFYTFEYYEGILKSILLNPAFAESNYFYRFYFEGGYKTQLCCPRILKREHFEDLRSNSWCFEWHCGTVQEVMEKHKLKSFTKLVLLDHMDWMTNRSIHEEWISLQRASIPGAKVLWRSANSKVDSKPFFNNLDIIDLSPTVYSKDRVKMYLGTFCCRMPHDPFVYIDHDLSPCQIASFPCKVKTALKMVLHPVLSLDICGFLAYVNHDAKMSLFYAAQAKGYDAIREKMLVARPEMMTSFGVVKKGHTWLDVGGATGRNVHYIRAQLDSFDQIIVLDICQELLEVGEANARASFTSKQCDRISWVCLDINSKDAISTLRKHFGLSKKKNSCSTKQEQGLFDTISFSYSLSMIPDWQKALRSASTLLKKNGRIIISDFDTYTERGDAIWDKLISSWYRQDGVRIDAKSRDFIKHDLFLYKALSPDITRFQEKIAGVPIPHYVACCQKSAVNECLQSLPSLHGSETSASIDNETSESMDSDDFVDSYLEGPSMSSMLLSPYSLFVSKATFAQISREFHSFHKNDLNAFLHVFSTGLGAWSAIQLITILLSGHQENTWFNANNIIFSYVFWIGLSTQPSVAALNAVIIYIFSRVSLWSVFPGISESSAFEVSLVFQQDIEFSLTSAQLCGLVIILSFALQELSHYLCQENTYMGSYFFTRDMLWMTFLHTLYLLPLVIEAFLVRQCFTQILFVNKNRCVFGEVHITSRKAIEELCIWIKKNIPYTPDTTHVYLHSLEGMVPDEVTKILELDCGIMNAFRNVFATHHFDIAPITGMNEIYVAATSPLRTEKNSDAVFYTPHTDGPFWFLPFVSCYRVLVSLTPNTMVRTRFSLQHESSDKVLDTNNVLGFDYNRELHWIDHVPGKSNEVRRSVLKLHYIVYPKGWKNYGKVAAWCNQAYNIWARKIFLRSLRPKSTLDHINAWSIYACTTCNAFLELNIGLSNILQILVSYACLGTKLFTIVTSFRHYATYIATYALANNGNSSKQSHHQTKVAHGSFMRDAKLYKSIAMFHLAIRVLPCVNLPRDIVGIVLVIAGFLVCVLATIRLGLERTYFGAEFGFLKPKWIDSFPYGYIPHPMIVGQIFSFGSILWWWGEKLTSESILLLCAHICCYLVHMIQETFNGGRCEEKED